MFRQSLAFFETISVRRWMSYNEQANKCYLMDLYGLLVTVLINEHISRLNQ